MPNFWAPGRCDSDEYWVNFGTSSTPPARLQYMLDCDMDKSTAEIGSYHLQGERNYCTATVFQDGQG